MGPLAGSLRRLLVLPLLLALVAVGLVAAPSSARTDDGELPGFDRSLHLPNASNARDVGGWRTSDGQWVKPGVAFRSNKLGGLQPDEWQTLRQHGVNHIVDLRASWERSDAPDQQPDDFGYQVADVVGLPPSGSPRLGDLLATTRCVSLGTISNLLSILKSLRNVDDAGTASGYLLEACWGGSMAAFRGVMTSLADEDKTVIFHCSAGKDRTGVASAILLLTLGVPWKSVLRDFELSNTYRGEGSVQGEWLQAWYDAVKSNWGSFDTFVRRGVGLSDETIADLKSKFLTRHQPQVSSRAS